jgi:hypothetical protein
MALPLAREIMVSLNAMLTCDKTVHIDIFQLGKRLIFGGSFRIVKMASEYKTIS